MLSQQRDQAVAHLTADRMSPREMRRALQREVVGFGRARGKDDLAAVSANEPRHLAARGFNRRLSAVAVDMTLAVRVTELLREVREHGFEDARIERGRGLVVEVNGRRVRPLRKGCGGRTHAALTELPRVFIRRYIAVHACRKWSISLSAVLQPRLTRIVEPAISGGAPIACSTWLGPTLPEEQAAPALTMTPSRSSAMTWVSAETPGSAIALVLGNLSARDPMITASGAVARTAASRSSRKCVTRS